MTFSRSASAPASTDLLDAATSGRGRALVDVARRIAGERGDAAFTIAEVVRGAGVSLKGFYATFSGKDQLLLALLATDTASGAVLVNAALAAEPDATPGTRLRTWIREVLALAALPEQRAYAGLLAREVRRLAEVHPHDLGPAIEPLLAQLRSLLRELGSSDASRDSLTVFGMVLDAVHRVSTGSVTAGVHADYLATFIARAISHLPGRQP
jgi:AcrR family transcriptional regulator